MKALTKHDAAVNLSGADILAGVSAVDGKGKKFLLSDLGSFFGSGGGSAVGSFNGRTGAVSLTSGDVTTALAFTPLSASALDTDTTLAANSDTKVPSQKAVKAYIDSSVAGLLDFKGSIACAANPNYPAAVKGDAYYVSSAGKVGGASGKTVDIGDVVIASADNAGGTEASVGASWFVLEHNLTGALTSANNLSDLADPAAARSNLGLTYFATGTDAANLTGTINVARLGANSITFNKLPTATAASLVGATAAGDFAQLTPAQAKSVLAIAESDVANLTTDLAAKAPLANPQFTGVAFYAQGAPTAKTTTGTLTIAELLTQLLTVTSATAVSLTLPTGTLSDAGILGGALATNEAFEWYIINLGSSSGAVTLAAGTNHTIVGNAVTAISTSSRWLTRKTASNTFITYRIG